MADSVSIEQIVTDINAMMIDFVEQIPNVSQKLALQGAAMLKLRIQQKGQRADGSSLGTYSDAELPTFFFKPGKKLKKDEFGENILEQNDHLSYKEWRKEHGLQTEHVDLTFTGDMFRRLGITSAGLESAGLYVVTIGGTTGEAQKKFDYNAERYGDIMQLSDAEEDMLLDALSDELDEIITKHGF